MQLVVAFVTVSISRTYFTLLQVFILFVLCMSVLFYSLLNLFGYWTLNIYYYNYYLTYLNNNNTFQNAV